MALPPDLLEALHTGKAVLPSDEAIKAEMIRRDLKLFVRENWDTLEQGNRLEWTWHIDVICDALMKVSRRELRGLVISVPPGTMKALDHDTPVPTTWGWRKHGELQAGDYVFGPDGKPRKILACTEEWEADTYAVEFDDRSEIVAAGDHLWEVERDAMSVAPKYRRGRKKVVVSTTELRTTDPQGTWSRRPDRIGVCHAIQWSPKKLLVDPYVLGAWLGDGGSNCGMLYAGEQDAHHFTQLGKVSRVVPATGGRKQPFYHILVDGLQTRLRLLGLLGNKHIPLEYLEAAEEQRWALLQGLMDTDGTCAKATGSCVFSNKNKVLIDQVLRLAHSLGLKAALTSHRAKLNGVDYGEHYAVTFIPVDGMQVFRLERKQQLVRGNQNARSRYRYVEKVTAAGRRKVKCIQVEGNIYLAGTACVPTHNSMLVSVMWPAWEWLPGNWPDEKSLYVSGTQKVSFRDSFRTRVILESNKYQKMVELLSVANDEEQWEFREGQNEKEHFENTVGGARYALTVGQRITGLRGNKVVVDDPVDVQEVITGSFDRITERMGEVLSWYDQKLYSRRNDLRKDPIVIIMQRLHELDLAGVVMSRNEPGYQHIVLPLEFDPDIADPLDPRTVKGEVLDPRRFPPYVVAETKVKLREQYSAQYGQRPIPGEGGMFKRAWFDNVTNYPWVGSGWHNNAALPEFHRRVLFVDCANKAKELSDYTVFGHWGQDKDQNAWLLDVLRDKLDMFALVETAARLIRELKPDVFVAEEAGNGIGLLSLLRKMFPGLSILGVIPKGEKDIRASNTTHWWASGRVFIPTDRCPWRMAYLEEHLKFPNVPKDDQVDMTSLALQWFHDNGSLFRHRMIVGGELIEDSGGGHLTSEGVARKRRIVHEVDLMSTLHEDFTGAQVDADQGEIMWIGLRAAMGMNNDD